MRNISIKENDFPLIETLDNTIDFEVISRFWLHTIALSFSISPKTTEEYRKAYDDVKKEILR